MPQESCGNTGYAGLVLLAALVSIEIARQLSADQMELLGNFFEALGENLALLASPPPACRCNNEEGAEP